MASNHLEPGTDITIVKLRPDGSESTRYGGTIVGGPENWIVATAPWKFKRLDTGYMVFEPGDHFIEYFATDDYYNAFALFSKQDEFKGWYCNVAMPTWMERSELFWHDLYLDVVVKPDGELLVLDEDELEESRMIDINPALHMRIIRAKDEIVRMIKSNEYPFNLVEISDPVR